MAPVWRANFEPCGCFTSSQRQPGGFLHRNMIGSCSCQAKNISNSGLQHGLHTLVISCSMGRKLGASKSMPINVTRSRCQKSRYLKGKCWQTCEWIQVSMHADACGMITEVLGTSQCSKQSSYRYFLRCILLNLVTFCYHVMRADWSPNGPGTPADKPPVSHSRTEIAETPRPGAKSFVVSFRFVYIAHLCTFAFCDLWPNLSCRYVLSFLVRPHRGLSLGGDSHVALPCDEDISHLFVSEAGEPECYADMIFLPN